MAHILWADNFKRMSLITNHSILIIIVFANAYFLAKDCIALSAVA